MDAKEKLITFLLRGRVIFCCYVKRFLTVSLLYLRNSNFQEENCPNFLPEIPPLCAVQVFVKSQTNATLSSFI